MSTDLKAVSLLLVGVPSTCLALGCAAFEGNGSHLLYSGELGAGESLRLVERTHQDAFRPNPQHNYSEPVLLVGPVHAPRLQTPVGHVAGRLDERPHFKFGQLEGRMDESGQRMWIAEKNPWRVLVTTDLATHATTGLDQRHPDWATRHDGVMLPSSRP